MLFKNGMVGYFADIAITPVIVLAAGCATGVGVAWAHSAIAGFLLWQIFEWAMHRHLLHGPLRDQHWVHHRFPNGDTGVPAFITLPAVALLLLACLAAFGAKVGGGLFTGFAIGYETYNLTHWAIHSGRWPHTGWLGGVARRHALHHRGVAFNFNVLLPIADLMFGTYRKA
jgi:hypothetical protein